MWPDVETDSDGKRPRIPVRAGLLVLRVKGNTMNNTNHTATLSLDTSPTSTPPARGLTRKGAARPDPTHFLDALGVHGLGKLEPALLAALATESPMLLIGAHGTAKSLLLLRLSEALGLRFRHYNASLVNFDDLVGYPLPDASGKLKFIETPASVWKAQVVFLDEISRCRPDQQNRLFSIIHEKRVQGISITGLKHRWAAMNPPPSEDDCLDDESSYCGSEPLDPALADRFPFVIEMPGWEQLGEAARRAIISEPERELAPDAGVHLQSLLASTVRALPRVEATLGTALCEWVGLLAPLLQQQGLRLSPRRLRMLYRNTLAVCAAAIPLGRGEETEALAWSTLGWSLPQRAEGKAIPLAQLQLAHQEAWDGAGLAADDPRRVLLAEPDPVRRSLLAVGLSGLSRIEVSAHVADGLAELPPGGRHALAIHLSDCDSVKRFTAATAEDVASLRGQAMLAQQMKTLCTEGSVAHQCYEIVEQTLRDLEGMGEADVSLIENVLLHALKEGDLQGERSVEGIVHSWQETRRILRGAAA